LINTTSAFSNKTLAGTGGREQSLVTDNILTCLHHFVKSKYSRVNTGEQPNSIQFGFIAGGEEVPPCRV